MASRTTRDIVLGAGLGAGLGLALAAATATSALAHHSSAAFDGTREVVVEGVVKDFQYTNPHAWLLVSSVDPSGKTVVWSFEAEGPSSLRRAGVKQSSFRAGDRVTVHGHPLKDGRAAAVLISAVKTDGQVLRPPQGGSTPDR